MNTLSEEDVMALEAQLLVDLQEPQDENSLSADLSVYVLFPLPA
jgi:hypothetical protein